MLNIDEHNTTYHSFNWIKYFALKESKFYHSILSEIKSDFESLDRKIRNSPERKRSGYVIKGYVPRTIITIFGKITFIRTKYYFYDKVIKKYRTIILFDKYFKVEPYKRIDLHLRLSIFKELTKGKRQQDIVDQFKAAHLTRVSISNLTKNLNIELLNNVAYKNYQLPKEIKEKEYIYINIDDTFVSLRDKDKKRKLFRIRLMVSHLGYTNNPLKKELLQKRAHYLIDKIPLEKKQDNIKQYAENIYQQLKFFYGDISNKHLIICGDGALWIKEVASYLKAEYVLDKFHIANLLFKSFPHTRKKDDNEIKIKNLISLEKNEYYRNFYESCSNLLNQGKVKKLIKILKIAKKEKVFIIKNKKIKMLIQYIKNNELGIVSYQKSFYIGSQTESMISHIIKSIKGYGAKIYNVRTFENLLNLRVAVINKIDPINIYYQEINNNFLLTVNY